MSTKTTLHLRAEQKPLEHRSALTPTTAKALIDAGYAVNVERSPTDPSRRRIFEDEEFVDVGAKLVEEESWMGVPSDHIIIGLKELNPDTFPLKHTHVQFAHCYKNQGGWQDVLSRFPRGGGTLLDLEFLVDEKGRRVAAFGYHAGFAGSALALKTWVHQLENGKQPLPGVDSFTDGKGYYQNEDEMVDQLKEELKKGVEKVGHAPRVLVMGALGRCGRGAVALFVKAGVPEENIVKWDLAETSGKPGPYKEIANADIFVNCIYLSDPIPPFINEELLNAPGRKLSVICDVSCDTTNPHNPVPVYTINTTFTDPTVPVELKSEPPLSVISIDHLPSLLPRESSEAFSKDLLPSLLGLAEWKSSPVWQRADKLFNDKVALLPAEMRQRDAS